MAKKLWTPEEVARLDAMHAEGKNDAEIAAALGRTQKSVHARRHRAWFDAQRHSGRIGQEAFFVGHERAIKVIAQMIRHGCTYDAIAERLGSTRERVSSFISWNRAEVAAAMRGKA